MIEAPRLSVKEQVELMLYARALALGICRHVKDYLTHNAGLIERQTALNLGLDDIDLDENTSWISRSTIS